MRNLLKALTLRQKIAIAATAVLVAGGLAGLGRWRQESDFRPLFTSLAPEDAAGIVRKLKEAGVEYRIADNGGTVLAPSGKIAELRLTLAAAGMPRSGRIGFELFDKTSFGASEFTEHVNYRRALEGELERSVMSLAEVEQARVHLTFPKESVFLENRQPAKASVMLRLRAGVRLSPENVVAISHLVASAVDRLAPEDVSVLDTRGNLLTRFEAKTETRVQSAPAAPPPPVPTPSPNKAPAIVGLAALAAALLAVCALLLRRTVRPPPKPALREPPASGVPGIHAMETADPKAMADVIQNEHPQTIAVLLSHLNPSQAAAFLAALPESTRSEVALRMTNLGRVPPEIVSEIVEAIASRLAAAAMRRAMEQYAL